MACQKTAVAVASVAWMGPYCGKEIPIRLRELSPALHVRSGSPRRRLAIIQPREGADRICMFPHRCWVTVSGHLTCECSTSTCHAHHKSEQHT